MAALINSVTQLKKILETKIQQALILTQEEIYSVIQKHIEDYYEEEVFEVEKGVYSNIPFVYQRTNRFRFDSLIKTRIIQTGNSLSCTVQIDEDYLKYKYPGNPSWKGNVSATGADVVSWANQGLHGDTVSGGENFWDEALDELGGKQGILNLMKKNLKKVGVPIA